MDESDHMVEDRVGSPVFEPDTMLPSQYFDRFYRRGDLEPERRLMGAVLEDAILLCVKNTGATDVARQTARIEAEEWIASRDASWFYSFENVCAVLDIDPEYIRRGLRAVKEAREPARRPPAEEQAEEEPTFRRASGD